MTQIIIILNTRYVSAELDKLNGTFGSEDIIFVQIDETELNYEKVNEVVDENDIFCTANSPLL